MIRVSCAALFLSLLACAAGAGPSSPPERPNFLFIMSDDVGYEAIGATGGESYKTPHLDALAASGLKFDHAYSMAVCHPSRVCLLTGKYPFRMAEAGWGDFSKAHEQKTFGHLLKSGGYATAVAGKWQLAMMKKRPNHPRTLGFDDSSLFGWHEGPRYYDPMIYQNGSVREGTNGKFGPDLYVDFLIDFMKRNKSGPFMAYYPMALCHDVTDDLKAPVPHGPQGRYDTYKEMVEAMDRCVGRLMKALDDLGLREKTLVIFTCDNGTPSRYISHADENGKLVRLPIRSMLNGKEVIGGKGRLTDAGTRVPTFASWKGVIPAGQVVDDLVDFSDFLPTFAELAGIDVPAEWNIDGSSFAARILDKGAAARTWAFAEHGGKYFVCTQRYKLYGDGRFVDVKADPSEKSAAAPSGEAEAARKVLAAAQAKIRYSRKGRR